jgi:hypothetical protein
MVIACCGFDVPRTMHDLPILQVFRGWNELPCVRMGRVYVVDGSAYFNRPGPRLVDSLEILAYALHPTIRPRRTVGFAPALQLGAEELTCSSRARSTLIAKAAMAFGNQNTGCIFLSRDSVSAMRASSARSSAAS